MLIVLAIPVIVAVAFAHRVLQAVAPSNMLITRIRRAGPSWSAGVGLVVLALPLLMAIRILTSATSGGAPSWLHLFVLVLAWDTIKFGIASCLVAFGCVRQLAVAAATSRRPPQNGDTCA